jgi:UDP-2,3-diacylglucosamine pyrophosphatase LpxH
MYYQKSQIQWLQEGDKNTKFFHNSLLKRRNQNQDIFFVGEGGEILERHEEIEKNLISHYRNCYLNQMWKQREATNYIKRVISNLVSLAHNADLCEK